MCLPLAQALRGDGADPRRERRNLSVIGRLELFGHARTSAGGARHLCGATRTGLSGDEQGGPVAVAGLKESVQRMSKPMLATMMGAVVPVLLVACANLANLLLARSSARQRDRDPCFPRRVPLAHRPSCSIECALLAMPWSAGAAPSPTTGAPDRGRVQPARGRRIYQHATTTLLARSVDERLDPRSSVRSCLFATLAFGLVPALHVSKTNPHETLKEGGRTIGGVRARRWTTTLMIGELALTLILLTETGLLWRSFVTLFVPIWWSIPPASSPCSFRCRCRNTRSRSSANAIHANAGRAPACHPAVSSMALSNLSPVSKWHATSSRSRRKGAAEGTIAGCHSHVCVRPLLRNNGPVDTDRADAECYR